jgi:hypothetical protein
MLLALSNSLVKMGTDHEVHVFLDEAPWESLYPSSAILTSDEDVEQRLRRDYAPKPGQSYDRSAKSQHLPGTLCDMAADARMSHGWG